MFSPEWRLKTVDKKSRRPIETRVNQALFEGRQRSQGRKSGNQVDARFTLSSRKSAFKDFAQMTAAEVRLAKAEIARLKLPYDEVLTRRSGLIRMAPVDPRHDARGAMRTGGDLVLPRFRGRGALSIRRWLSSPTFPAR